MAGRSEVEQSPAYAALSVGGKAIELQSCSSRIVTLRSAPTPATPGCRLTIRL
jgi:hypothetical protein